MLLDIPEMLWEVVKKVDDHQTFERIKQVSKMWRSVALTVEKSPEYFLGKTIFIGYGYWKVLSLKRDLIVVQRYLSSWKNPINYDTLVPKKLGKTKKRFYLTKDRNEITDKSLSRRRVKNRKFYRIKFY